MSPDHLDLAPPPRSAPITPFPGVTTTRAAGPIPLDELLRHMEHEIRSLAPAQVSVEMDGLFQPRFPRIAFPMCDAEDLIRHLVIDALDAIHGEGTLRISLEEMTVGIGYQTSHLDLAPGRYVLLSCSDSAAATEETDSAPSTLLKAVPPPTLLDKGRSLGLSAAYDAIQRVGGYLAVSHRLHETVMRIYFPVA